MIQLGHKLARLSGLRSYRERAGQVWSWVRRVVGGRRSSSEPKEERNKEYAKLG